MTSKALLIAADLACFLIFALIGLRNHDEGITPSSVLRVVLPFGVSWLASATAFGLYSRTTPPTVRHAWHRVLEAWLPAWALGVILRSLVFGRSFVPAFAVVALLFNGLLLVLWRTVVAALLEKRAAPAG